MRVRSGRPSEQGAQLPFRRLGLVYTVLRWYWRKQTTARKTEQSEGTSKAQGNAAQGVDYYDPQDSRAGTDDGAVLSTDKIKNIWTLEDAGMDDDTIDFAFPEHIAIDPAGDVTKEQFLDHCGTFTVLPDFWKFHAMNLGIENRSEFWKLDLNSEGWLAGNFMPHGAPVVRKDKDDKRHFVIWNAYQLHGDVGERMGLTRKMSTGAKVRRSGGQPKVSTYRTFASIH